MIQVGPEASLDSAEAAEFLGVSIGILQGRAKAGIIPGAKVGKEWRFLASDLAAYLRAQYPANQPRVKPCPSANAARSSTSTSSTRASDIDSLLDLPTARKRSASTTNSERNCGGKVVRLAKP
ncbi:MAG: helix-turn-helix domain-containing protein [Rhodospirillales bacterium]|nr:helix-turn-helix domain-containing protein [Rhodospirillales bacterium]